MVLKGSLERLARLVLFSQTHGNRTVTAGAGMVPIVEGYQQRELKAERSNNRHGKYAPDWGQVQDLNRDELNRVWASTHGRERQ